MTEHCEGGGICYPLAERGAMVATFRGVSPILGPSVYIHPSAQVIGDVRLGEDVSVWCNAVIRGDVNGIRVGRGTNIQDCSVLHVEHERHSLSIGEHVTVGHRAVLHGCVVGDDCLIGIGAIVLNGAVIGQGSVIGAGALVPEGCRIPPGSVVLGIPGKIIRTVNEEEKARFRLNADHYIELAKSYQEGWA